MMMIHLTKLVFFMLSSNVKWNNIPHLYQTCSNSNSVSVFSLYIQQHPFYIYWNIQLYNLFCAVVQKEQHFLIECSQISEKIYNKNKLRFLGLNSMQPLYDFVLLPLLFCQNKCLLKVLHPSFTAMIFTKWLHATVRWSFSHRVLDWATALKKIILSDLWKVGMLINIELINCYLEFNQ